MDRYFTDLASAFVRGSLMQPSASVQHGIDAGLRLHKLKMNSELPQVEWCVDGESLRLELTERG